MTSSFKIYHVRLLAFAIIVVDHCIQFVSLVSALKMFYKVIEIHRADRKRHR